MDGLTAVDVDVGVSGAGVACLDRVVGAIVVISLGDIPFDTFQAPLLVSLQGVCKGKREYSEKDDVREVRG